MKNLKLKNHVDKLDSCISRISKPLASIEKLVTSWLCAPNENASTDRLVENVFEQIKALNADELKAQIDELKQVANDAEQVHERWFNPKNWSNVYVLRQEYNKYQRRWFPIIVYWGKSDVDNRYWQEALCTEDGSSYYHTEVKDYTAVTRKGTDKCNAEEVNRIVEQYKSECEQKVLYEVQKLASCRPDAD